MDEEIKRLFESDIREKKKVGSNIFKRVSSRRGGTNMSTMRVPTQKEQKLLSGEVKVYNMKDIITYEEFMKKEVTEQKQLLEFWRNEYKTADILKGMEIDKNVFYRLLNELDIPKKDMGQGTKKTLSDEEFKKYYDDNNNFISFPLFKKLVFWQQQLLFEKYLSRFGNIQLLNKEWKGSKLNTLYYISSKIGKTEEEHQQPKVVQTDFEETVQTTEENTPTVNEKPQEEIEPNQDILKHDVDIRLSASSESSFFFSFKGHYEKEVILRRLKMLMEEIEEAEEPLSIDVFVQQK